MKKNTDSVPLIISLSCLVTLPAVMGLAQDTFPQNKTWLRHVIDNTSKGADGVRLDDVNCDGHPDIVTGWEQGGIIRVYVNPGQQKELVAKPWPAVVVGKVESPEDAVFTDLDGDGAMDVVSCCEGKTKCVFVHWAPKDPKQYLTGGAWLTDPIPATKDKTQWMFALPMQIDRKGPIDLVVGSKNADAIVGWLEAPDDPRSMKSWTLHKLYDAGWIMSLICFDVDGDGDQDIVVSDRKGKKPGVLWLENPGAKLANSAWPEHRIGADGREVMFADVTDLDGDCRLDILTAVKPSEIHWFRSPDDPTKPWPYQIIPVEFPAGIGTAKSVRAGDIDGNGRLDMVFSCEDAKPPKSGVVWLSCSQSSSAHNAGNATSVEWMARPAPWTAHDVSGDEGIKFDLVELCDLDGDGDLDIIACEEKQNLGVFWYENSIIIEHVNQQN